MTNGLTFFRPSKPLPAGVVADLITTRLPALRALRVLDLSSAELTPAILLMLGRLAATEGKYQTVRSLNLWDNHLGVAGTEALAQALEMGGFRSTLQGLYVRANQVGGHGEGESEGDDAMALFQVLRAGACDAPLTSLSLAQNHLDATAAVHLGSALASPFLKRLRKLDLHLNRLGDRGAVAVAEGLAAGGGMPCLDECYLGFNGLGDAGARAIADCLPFLPVLRELDLASNLISNDGALALAARLSLEVEGTPPLLLETLDLRGGKVGDDGCCAFRDFLTESKWCPNLQAVYLDDNRAIRVRGREALQALQAARGIQWAEGGEW